MSFLDRSIEEMWRELCDEIDAEFVKGGFLRTDKVVAKVKEWTITLDTDMLSTGFDDEFTKGTRMRAPYVNKDGFRFTISRKGIFDIGVRLFGMPVIEVGYPEFDRDFIIKGNDEHKLRALFANPRIRQLIQSQPSIYLGIRDDEGWFGPSFPEGVDELYFSVEGVIKDVERLKSLFELFGEILNHLCHIGSACEEDPGVVL